LLLAVLGTAACDDGDGFDLLNPPGRVIATVSTFRDTAVDFSALKTFALPDTVVHFATGTGLPVSRVFDDLIINRVRQNLIMRGYIPAPAPDSIAPDFTVLVGATTAGDQTAWVSYPWFSIWGFYSGWDWYVPGFDDTWGIVYPWAASATVTSFPRGTLLVDLIPSASVNDSTKTITAAWSGIATSLLNGLVTSATVGAAIDEMFVQSPYLQADTLSNQQ
jgi:hypothetical protein